jgi:hypothetical protein
LQADGVAELLETADVVLLEAGGIEPVEVVRPYLGT